MHNPIEQARLNRLDNQLQKTKLIQLIREHPTLPIIPLVHRTDVFEDEYWQSTFGSIGEPYVLKFFPKEDDCAVVFDETEHHNYVVEKVYNDDYISMIETDEDYEEAYNKIQWVEAIIIPVHSYKEV